MFRYVPYPYVVLEGQHGCLEAACQRNAEEFSVGDCVEWLRELQFVYGLDSDQKLAALDSLQEYDYQAVSELCKLWAIKPQHSVQGTVGGEKSSSFNVQCSNACMPCHTNYNLTTPVPQRY